MEKACNNKMSCSPAFPEEPQALSDPVKAPLPSVVPT